MNHLVEKQTKQVNLMNGSCKMILSWLTTLVSLSEGVSQGWTVPVVVAVLYGSQTPVALSSRETPTTTVFHTWDLAPLSTTSLGR